MIKLRYFTRPYNQQLIDRLSIKFIFQYAGTGKKLVANQIAAYRKSNWFYNNNGDNKNEQLIEMILYHEDFCCLNSSIDPLLTTHGV